MQKRFWKYGLISFFLLTLGFVVYNLPPVKSRLDWRLDELRAKIKYEISPPEQVVFVPQGQEVERRSRIPQTQFLDLTPSPTLLSAESSTSSSIVPYPAITPTAIPDKVRLSGYLHEYQGWNNCGPATLAMALSFWGWQGNQYDIASLVKPYTGDKNVMPFEMADYVEKHTKLSVVVRSGGELDLLKRILAAGYPVITEKGFEDAKFNGWMGHYELITGFDNDTRLFTAQDSFMGPDIHLSYETLESYWRAFNFTYLVVFPSDRQFEINTVLGEQAEESYADRFAAQKALDEISSFSGRDLFFAWFNRGTSLTTMQDFSSAANAYDQAFALYPSIQEAERPWRMIWYQTGPYQAYYYTGRYQDVIDLATKTLDNMSDPVLEESYFWRALAREALGDTIGADDDLKKSLEYHPGFEATLSYLQEFGVSTSIP